MDFIWGGGSYGINTIKENMKVMKYIRKNFNAVKIWRLGQILIKLVNVINFVFWEVKLTVSAEAKRILSVVLPKKVNICCRKENYWYKTLISTVLKSLLKGFEVWVCVAVKYGWWILWSKGKLSLWEGFFRENSWNKMIW